MRYADPEAHDLHPTGRRTGASTEYQKEQQDHLWPRTPRSEVSWTPLPGGIAESATGAEGDHVEQGRSERPAEAHSVVDQEQSDHHGPNADHGQIATELRVPVMAESPGPDELAVK
ncbi:uncharacterized protein METZ01_LOCUS359345, partial [marine metagenome]